jgi:hypothetical protein
MSRQGDAAVRQRFMDYFFLAGFAVLLSGKFPIILLPLLVTGLSQPRKLLTM